MHNEIYLLVLAILDIIFVFVAARMGSARLFGSVALNLILISIFGAKFVSILGYTTNVGNIFYACVFLATYFILERQSKKEAINTIWFGLVVTTFFIFFSQIVANFINPNSLDAIDVAMKTLFSFSIRVAIASALAYIFAQYINICMFVWIRDKTGDKFLWLQVLGATIVGQLIDSCLFFTIAFLDMSGALLLQAIITGWIVKIGVIVLAIPALYFDKSLLKNNK